MALKESYGPANKQQHTLPFEREVRTYFNVWSVGYWLVETITTERFSYVGMTKSAAQACVDALKIAYTKSILIPSVQSDGEVTYSMVNMCVADIQGNHVGGLMWDVNVDVNEPSYDIELFTPPEE